MLSVTLLPARLGDAIWIRWGKPDTPHQILIDMGTEEVGLQVRDRLLSLPQSARQFELLVVTHVDRDHIGGVLTCLADADPIAGLTFQDVWFNGFSHLSETAAPAELEPMGPAQGERLSTWLTKQHWNAAFGGGSVQRRPGQPPPRICLQDGLTLTILGPTPDRLGNLRKVWREEVAEALRKGTLATVAPGLEQMGPKEPPVLEDSEDLVALAESRTLIDTSEANGSSIALLLEYRGRTVLLAGDAFAEDLIAGIEAVSGGGKLRLDAFKLPHHCSQSNVVKSMVEAVECDCWLISTDGTQFRHPDPIAVARIIRHSQIRPAHLAFNVPSKFNGWWDNDSWRHRYGYQTSYGTTTDGLTALWSVDRD